MNTPATEARSVTSTHKPLNNHVGGSQAYGLGRYEYPTVEINVKMGYRAYTMRPKTPKLVDDVLILLVLKTK